MWGSPRLDPASILEVAKNCHKKPKFDHDENDQLFFYLGKSTKVLNRKISDHMFVCQIKDSNSVASQMFCQ